LLACAIMSVTAPSLAMFASTVTSCPNSRYHANEDPRAGFCLAKMIRRVILRPRRAAAFAEATFIPAATGLGLCRAVSCAFPPGPEQHQVTQGALATYSASGRLGSSMGPLSSALGSCGRSFSVALKPMEQAPLSVTLEVDLSSDDPSLDELTPSAVSLVPAFKPHPLIFQGDTTSSYICFHRLWPLRLRSPCMATGGGSFGQVHPRAAGR